MNDFKNPTHKTVKAVKKFNQNILWFSYQINLGGNYERL